jgi:multicomponent Na+:H+ antiporter subunit A
MLILSAVTIAGGIGIYARRSLLQGLVQPLNVVVKWGPEQWYQWILDGMFGLARLQTAILQSGYLRYYLLIIIVTTVGLTGYTLVAQRVISAPGLWQPLDVRYYELLVAALILIAAWVVVRVSSRLAAVAALGVVGYGIALIFIMFGAPDLAMTQFSIETLSVILLVLIIYRLPRFRIYTSTASRLRDTVVALAGGGLMTLLILVVTALPDQSRLAPYFVENSVSQAKGHNVVNVILVDFRGFDTMGEITVLSIAAIGVYALLKLRLEKPTVSAKTPRSTGIYPISKPDKSRSG